VRARTVEGIQRLERRQLVGEDLLVAPVLTPETEARQVWIPPGTWTSIWDGTPYQGPGWAEVPAPMGEPPALSRVAPLRLLGEAWATWMR